MHEGEAATSVHDALRTLTEGTPEEIDREVDAAFEALFPPVKWAIRENGTSRYWTGGTWEDGWGRNYTASEKLAAKLPEGAVWVCGECGQGDPTSVGHVCR